MMMGTTVDECEAAMNDVDIDDNALVAVFRSCVDAARLVHRAVLTNDVRAVRLLIAERFDLSHVYESGRTLLHIAYEYAALPVVDMLLAAGVRADSRDDWGALPWHFAARNVDATVMARLIADGVDVNDGAEWRLVHGAAMNPNHNVLAMLVAAGADVLARAPDGNTACHFAIINPNVAVLSLLIPLSDINAVNNQCRTPCICAAFEKNSHALELLIAAGANVHVVDVFDDTALTMALRVTDEKSVELLVDANADVNTVVPVHGTTAMHLAAMWCNHRLLGKLIAAGGNVKARDKCRRTPCHMFSEATDPRGDGAFRSMAMLIAAGANVHARNNMSRTPLHCTSKVGFSDCMSLLLKAGANVGARDEDGSSPLHLVKNVASAAMLVGAKADLEAGNNVGDTASYCAWDRPQVLSFLIAAGANVLSAVRCGKTALHYAAMNENSIEAMSVLINAGVDVNQGDNSGNCAGHLAARRGLVENLNFLLSHGARINRRNNVGETMLYLAAELSEFCVVDFLLDAGAAPDIRSRESVSPLELGLMRNLDIAKRLLQAGASPHGIGPYGGSACHFAARSSRQARQSLRLLIDVGANVHAIDDFGASVAHGADASAFPLLRSLGVNLNGVDDRGNTPCHVAYNGDALVALFALGATMTAKNKFGYTPYDSFLAEPNNKDDVLIFVAAGIGFGVQTQVTNAEIGAAVIAGGGRVSEEADAVALAAREGDALKCIFDQQRQLFRLRALEVCMGLQSLRVSALELCAILAHMFAPLESVVPFGFAWRVVCAVKHFKE
jgi:ankyrin repeat protein